MGPAEDPISILALPRSLEPVPGKPLGDVGVRPGLLVGVSLEDRLGLDGRITQTFAQVEEWVELCVKWVREELKRREVDLERERQDGERLKSEKQEVEERVAYLSRQVGGAVMLQ